MPFWEVSYHPQAFRSPEKTLKTYQTPFYTPHNLDDPHGTHGAAQW
mgnify:CR=1 FL=1